MLSVLGIVCAGSLFAALPQFEKFHQLKEELGLVEQAEAKETDCHLFIVHHGDTQWTVEERLQGWIDIPLNEVGKAQMQEIAKKLSAVTIDAIYSSSLIRAVESAAIIQNGRDCEIIIDPLLRGESHGNLEGLQKSQYEKDPHYVEYKSLSSEDRIFFSVGEGGLSKADVARFSIPAIKEICRKHPGQNVVVVTHGGVLKFMNFLLGNYTPEEIHGEMLRIDGDGTHLSLLSSS